MFIELKVFSENLVGFFFIRKSKSFGLLISYKMPSFHVLVVYGGEWVKDGEEYNYRGGNLKGLVVDSEIPYQELINKIYSVTEINPEEFSINVKCAFKLSTPVPLFEISDDQSLRFYLTSKFVDEIPLCVSAMRLIKESNLDASGSNHLQPLMSLAPLDKNMIECNLEEDGDFSGTPVVHRDDLDNDDQDVEVEVKGNGTGSLQESQLQLDHKTQSRPQNGEKVKSSIVPASSNHKYPLSKCYSKHFSALGSTCNDDVEAGQLFPSKAELHCKLSVIAIKKNFEFRVRKSTKEMLYVVCIGENCKWRLRSNKLKGSSYFKVGKYHNIHTCSLGVVNHDHRQASSRVVGHLLKSKYEGSDQQFKPHDIIEDMQREYGVNISYDKARRAREDALILDRKSLEKSYDTLARYCEVLKIKNPGTVTHIELENGNHFKYFFMALGSCIRGLHGSIRPLIVFDEICLKGRYRGTLLVGACVDGNNQVYPLAFAIGNRETDQLWGWFIDKLNGAIGNVNELVFISDMKSGIVKPIDSIFPSAFHGACIYRMSLNLKAKFKNDTIITLFWAAANAYRESEFQEFWTQIMLLDGDAAKYLEEVGFSKWARAYSTCQRYNIMTINVVECLNSIFGDAREMSITTLIEHSRLLLERWFLERRDEASKITTHLTSYAEGILQCRNEKSLTMHVSSIDCYKSHVKDGYQDEIVNINTRECSCREFDLDQLPCAHALAVARDQNINPYSLCSPYYTNQKLISAYAEPIFPVGPISECKEFPSPMSGAILPPKPVCRAGRRRKEGILSTKEDHVLRKCGICGGTDHNRKTCRNPLR